MKPACSLRPSLSLVSILLTILTLASTPIAAQTETVLYRFRGGSDGAIPWSAPIIDARGNLYGTTQYGGGQGSCAQGSPCGTVYRLRPQQKGSWSETILHRFTGGNDGGFTRAQLIFDPGGNLYGTTYLAG